MKIAINARFIIKDKLEGIGNFSLETVMRITKAHPEHHFFLIFDRKPDSELQFGSNSTIITLSPPARHPILWYIWFEYSLKSFLKKLNPDLFVSLDGYIPLNLKIPVLNVIHDIAFEHYPKDISRIAGLYYKYFFPKFALQADRIATVSQFSKTDLISKYKLASEKIDIVYNGASERFKPLSHAKKTEVRQSLTGGKDYFIYVGALHQRKNIAMLLKAYDQFRKKHAIDVKLVLTGRKAWKTREMELAYENMHYKEDVIFTGRVSDEKLADYIGSALAMTYISYFEGFGIPILESFYAATPAITSDITSLPEVAGEAALKVNPFDEAQITKAMYQISTDVELRNKLISNTEIQKQKYSWDKTANLLYESMLKTIEDYDKN
jgi:glycosyltransferase involved in cell wall biosynthesis